MFINDETILSTGVGVVTAAWWLCASIKTRNNKHGHSFTYASVGSKLTTAWRKA